LVTSPRSQTANAVEDTGSQRKINHAVGGTG
jgi:hypothetical protein